MSLRKRILGKKLAKFLLNSPVTLVMGARQTGKTTLVKQVAKEEKYSYSSFDDISMLSVAKNDPAGFIKNLVKPAILDEVQRATEVFLPIKVSVDENRIAGNFALTASANPLLLPRLSDSLAGRMQLLTLYPFSQGEIAGHTDLFIDRIFDMSHTFFNAETIFQENLINRILTGGYPSVQDLDDDMRNKWFSSYVTTILVRDVKDLAHIEGLKELPHLLKLLATRAGTALNLAELSRTSGIARTTLSRYITILETLFLIRFQPAWHANVSKRLVKSPKLYLNDTGLLSYLIDTNHDRIQANRNLMGNLLENFVASEIIKQTTWSKTRVDCFHFRTQGGIEADIVLENGRGDVVCIEVKSRQSITPDDFKGLRFLQQELGKKFIRGVVLYTGSQQITFDDKLLALPVSALWAT